MHHPCLPLRLCAALVLIAPALAAAAPGDVIGTNVTLQPIGPADDVANAVAIQSDGTFLVAGNAGNGNNNGSKTDFAFARFNPNGTLDTSLNPTPGISNPPAPGTVTTGVGPTSSGINALLVQPDGKVVAVGFAGNGDGAANTDFALVRYAADGTIDTTFNANQAVGTGIVTTPIGSGDDQPFAAVLQADGEIVAAGASDNGTDKDFALARYDTVGALDGGFGDGGITVTNVRGGDDGIFALAVQPDGKIVAAGYAIPGGGVNGDFALARYTAAGQLDPAFNAGGALPGTLHTDFGGNDSAYAVAVQPDGKIVAAGFGTVSNRQEFALARYNTDGSLDATFGPSGNGMVATAVGSGSASAYSLAIQPDGAILAGGTDGANFILVRYDAAGIADATFGSDGTGVVTTPAGSGTAAIKALALDADGSFVAVGYADNADGDKDFAVARYRAVDSVWDLTPDSFTLGDGGALPAGDYATSQLVKVSGLSNGVAVPVVVRGGQYALGATTYYGERGWVKNGDELNVRQVAVAGTSTTTLTIGGVGAVNNDALAIGTPATGTFSTSGISGGGSGALSPWGLGLLAAGWLAARRRRGRR